jgi:hypothetical protein
MACRSFRAGFATEPNPGLKPWANIFRPLRRVVFSFRFSGGAKGIDRAPAVNKERGVRTESALMKRLALAVVALGSQAVVSFAHKRINS